MLSVTIVLILMIIPVAILQVSGQCPQNKYGPDCRYDCHCDQGVTCHNQTGCNGNCAVGWDGITCQRQNVALNRPTTQTGAHCYPTNGNRFCHNSGFAVNGKSGHKVLDTPCTLTQSDTPVEWTVKLDNLYNIYRFKIYNRNETGCPYPTQCGARLNMFILSVGNTSSPNYQVCYEDTTNTQTGPGSIIEKICNQLVSISGNSVKISLNTSKPLTLCEVLLYVCSPGWYGEFCQRECESTINCARCDVTGIRCEECVTGRYGEHCDQPCGHCWKNNTCVKENGSCPVISGNPTCATGYTGDNCTSMCDKGNYGPDCEELCGFCAQGMNFCDIVSGDCPDVQPRCVLRKTGSKCKTDCIAGTYGPDCKKCGSCAGGPGACDVTSGFCTNTNPKCLDGFQGDRCNQSCDAGTYGQNCSGVCGSCAEHTVCDTTSGNCQERPGLPKCKTGYSGPRCDQERWLPLTCLTRLPSTIHGNVSQWPVHERRLPSTTILC